jgi:hypothetical protein
VGIEGRRLRHLHDRDDLKLCRWIAKRTAHYLEGVRVHWSESSSDYLPFYLTANLGENLADDLSETAVHRAFSGVIYPQARIQVFPFEGTGGKHASGPKTIPSRGTGCDGSSDPCPRLLGRPTSKLETTR